MCDIMYLSYQKSFEEFIFAHALDTSFPQFLVAVNVRVGKFSAFNEENPHSQQKHSQKE